MQLSRRQALASLGALVSLSAVSSPRPRSGPRPRAAEFLDAVRAGSLERVRALLEEDPALAGSADESGRSAFVLAHLAGHVAVAACLRETGLELDIVEAVLAEDWPRVETLVKEDPGLLRAAHPIGGTPLYAAALVGSRGPWRLRGLGCLSDDAPAGGTGFTPARGALEASRPEWARIGISDLCGNGGDVNAPQRAGSSVLHGAVARRDATLVRLAIRKGADPKAVDAQGRTARALAQELTWEEGAALLEHPETLPRDHRASRYALDANREPIRRADLSDVPQARQNEVTGSSHFNLKRLRELVTPDERLIWSVSTDDELAIEACAHVGSRDVIRFHLDHGAPLSLPTAVSLGDLEAVRFWLQRDPQLVHERGAHDFAVLWYAVLGGGSVEMAECLVELGVPLEQNSMGTTTLHWCAMRKDVELARWLLEQGADPEPVGYFWNRDGETPLQVAEAEGNTAVAAVLREAGARR